jgi:hypothetical protein
MKLFKYAALLALAAVPLLIVQKKAPANGQKPAGETVDTDSIFEYELKAE